MDRNISWFLSLLPDTSALSKTQRALDQLQEKFRRDFEAPLDAGQVLQPAQVRAFGTELQRTATAAEKQRLAIKASTTELRVQEQRLTSIARQAGGLTAEQQKQLTAIRAQKAENGEQARQLEEIKDSAIDIASAFDDTATTIQVSAGEARRFGSQIEKIFEDTKGIADAEERSLEIQRRLAQVRESAATGGQVTDARAQTAANILARFRTFDLSTAFQELIQRQATLTKSTAGLVFGLGGLTAAYGAVTLGISEYNRLVNESRIRTREASSEYLRQQEILENQGRLEFQATVSAATNADQINAARAEETKRLEENLKIAETQANLVNSIRGGVNFSQRIDSAVGDLVGNPSIVRRQLLSLRQTVSQIQDLTQQRVPSFNGAGRNQGVRDRILQENDARALVSDLGSVEDAVRAIDLLLADVGDGGQLGEEASKIFEGIRDNARDSEIELDNFRAETAEVAEAQRRALLAAVQEAQDERELIAAQTRDLGVEGNPNEVAAQAVIAARKKEEELETSKDLSGEFQKQAVLAQQVLRDLRAKVAEAEKERKARADVNKLLEEDNQTLRLSVAEIEKETRSTQERAATIRAINEARRQDPVAAGARETAARAAQAAADKELETQRAIALASGDIVEGKKEENEEAETAIDKAKQQLALIQAQRQLLSGLAPVGDATAAEEANSLRSTQAKVAAQQSLLQLEEDARLIAADTIGLTTQELRQKQALGDEDFKLKQNLEDQNRLHNENINALRQQGQEAGNVNRAFNQAKQTLEDQLTVLQDSVNGQRIVDQRRDARAGFSDIQQAELQGLRDQISAQQEANKAAQQAEQAQRDAERRAERNLKKRERLLEKIADVDKQIAEAQREVEEIQNGLFDINRFQGSITTFNTFGGGRSGSPTFAFIDQVREGRDRIDNLRDEINDLNEEKLEIGVDLSKLEEARAEINQISQLQQQAAAFNQAGRLISPLNTQNFGNPAVQFQPQVNFGQIQQQLNNASFGVNDIDGLRQIEQRTASNTTIMVEILRDQRQKMERLCTIGDQVAANTANIGLLGGGGGNSGFTLGP